MLYLIILVTFVVILLINFTLDFIRNRNSFKKNTVDENFLENNFYNKYNQHPIEFEKTSGLKYQPLKPLDNVVIDNNTQLMVVNGFIGLINGIIENNEYFIGMNPLIRNMDIKNIDWKKIIWGKKYKNIQLQRIINFYFFTEEDGV